MTIADERIIEDYSQPSISVEPVASSAPVQPGGIANIWLSIIYIILGVLIIGVWMLMRRRKASSYSNFPPSGGDNNPTP